MVATKHRNVKHLTLSFKAVFKNIHTNKTYNAQKDPICSKLKGPSTLKVWSASSTVSLHLSSRPTMRREATPSMCPNRVALPRTSFPEPRAITMKESKWVHVNSALNKNTNQYVPHNVYTSLQRGCRWRRQWERFLSRHVLRRTCEDREWSAADTTGEFEQYRKQASHWSYSVTQYQRWYNAIGKWKLNNCSVDAWQRSRFVRDTFPQLVHWEILIFWRLQLSN